MSKRRPRPIVPKAGPVLVTRADGSSEVQDAKSPTTASRDVRSAERTRAEEAKVQSVEAWRRATNR